MQKNSQQSLKSTLPLWDNQPKNVLLRADLNVPLDAYGNIANDFRLRAIIPTLDYLLRIKNSSVIIIGHLGRPQCPNPKLSTRILSKWFNNHGISCAFASDIACARQLQKNNRCVILENIRFFPEEKKADISFAKKLASLASYYVQDAFGALHRDDTSLRLTALEFPETHRSIGFLVEKEITELNRLFKHPKKPFVCIVGGGKVADKIPLIKNLIPHITTLLLCPAISSTFLKAQGISVGKSLVDDASIPLCKEIIEFAQQHNVSLMLPHDYQIALDSLDGTLMIAEIHNIPENGIATSIGPHTIELFGHAIREANTIFYNGMIGFANRPETFEGMLSLVRSIAQSDGWSIIAGGDSVGLVEAMHYEHDIDFLSSGGGATLAYLSGMQLPGLEPFLLKKDVS